MKTLLLIAALCIAPFLTGCRTVAVVDHGRPTYVRAGYGRPYYSGYGHHSRYHRGYRTYPGHSRSYYRSNRYHDDDYRYRSSRSGYYGNRYYGNRYHGNRYHSGRSRTRVIVY